MNFPDIFEEAGPRRTPFHGGFGMLNYQDLPKPSFFARLGDVRLNCSDPDAFVCRDQAGGIQALFWNFTITHPGPSIINQEFYQVDQAPGFTDPGHTQGTEAQIPRLVSSRPRGLHDAGGRCVRERPRSTVGARAARQ